MQKKHDFLVIGGDTDSVTLCKQDMSEFSQEELDKLTEEINSISDELIRWEFEFYIPKMIVLKAKNYIMKFPDGKIKTKGSAIRDQKKPKILQQFVNEVIQYLIDDKQSELITLYHSYVKQTFNIQDITPWAKKLTITDKITGCVGHETLNKEEKKEKGLRKNETDVYDALKGRYVQEGDKILVYFNNNNGLSMVEDWDGTYDQDALLKNLYNSIQIFANIIDMDQFLNYTLKRNKKTLGEL